MPMNQPTTIQANLTRVTSMLATVRALRAFRWSMEWPQGNAERPTMPDHVREFERANGALPASAERVLAETHPKT